MRRTLVPLTLLLAAAACSDGSSGHSVGTEVATYEVTKRTLRVTVSEKGTLKAKRQVSIRPDIPGQGKIVSLIEEGTVVKEGDVLCELDATQITQELSQLQNRLIQLQAEVKAAEAELEIQLSQNEADRGDAELKHRFAEVELERYEKGELVQERKKREVRVEEARSALDRATRKYEQMPALLEEGFVTQSQVEEERINKVKAESELELAELDLKTYLEYSHPKDLAQKKADVKNAAAELYRVKQKATAREAQKRSSLERQKREQASVQARFDTQRKVLDNMTIRAPGPGIVVYGSSPWDDDEIKVGSNVYSGHQFMSLPDLTEMEVAVAIHEADIAKVKPGQKVFVEVETAAGQMLEGKVLKVAPVASSGRRRWYDDTKRFSVDIELEGDIGALELKPGLTAKVEILVDELEDQVAVPSQAVFSESGKFYVFLMKDGVADRQEITIEEGNARYVVVKSGLELGQKILLYNPETMTDGAPAAGAPPGKSRPSSGPTNGKP